jgi:prepilin-type N-terminal cleavage/methylation domain-containing protein
MKSNKKGFTLIELIIVSTIMVMIMGAILNFIQPMNNFYSRTLYNSDANDVGSILQDYFEKEVRYSTNMCILEGYEGVPDVTGGYLRDFNGKKAIKQKFTDVIIIDNNSLRGRVYSTYDENKTAAHRKHATGALLKAKVGAAGIDMDTLNILGKEELYSDMRCEFEAYLNIDDAKNKCITLSSKLWKPEGNGVGYDFNKIIFNQTRDFELVNINLRDADKMMYSAEYWTTRVDPNDTLKYLAQTLDYSKFARATSASAPSDGISEMYAGVDSRGVTLPFTYIFYTKAEPETEDVVVSVNTDEGVSIDEKSYTSGSLISDSDITAWTNTAKGMERGAYTDPTTGERKFEEFSHFEVNGVDLETFKSTILTNDIEVVAIYSRRVIPTPDYIVSFYDSYDDLHNWLGHGTYNSNSYREVPIYGIACEDGDGNLDDDEVSSPSGDELHVFDHWEDASGNPLVAGGRAVYSNESYYAVYNDVPQVVFGFRYADEPEIGGAEGSLLASGATMSVRYDRTSSSFLADPQLRPIELEVQNGIRPYNKEFKYWEILDPSDPDTVLGKVSDLADFTSLPTDGTVVFIQPHLEDTPTGGTVQMYNDSVTFNHEYARWTPTEPYYYPKTHVSLHITNEDPWDGNDFSGTKTIKVKFKQDLESQGVQLINTNGSGASFSLSADTVTIVYTGTLSKCGGRADFNFDLKCPYEYVQADASKLLEFDGMYME